MSGILSEETEQKLIKSFLERLDSAVEAREMQHKEFPYMQQAKLLKELGISTTYLTKLKAHGLKQVQLEENDRTVWYKRSAVEELMDSLAE